MYCWCILLILLVPEFAKNEDETERLIGGSNAQPGQYPWAAALFYNNQFICTSSILSPTTLMTAAHCVVINGFKQSPTLFYAIANVNKSSPSVRIEFSDLIVHPLYFNVNNDIALFKTTFAIPFDDNVQPICIARPDILQLPYLNATAMGWGKTNRIRLFTVIPDILQHAEQTIVPNTVCGITNPGVDPTKICATGTPSNPLTGICSGDSGGPLVHLSADQRPVEIGIASYINSIIGCEKVSPAVFTRVSFYNNFIMQAADDSSICTV